MILPPLSLYLNIASEGHKKRRIWVPLFLVWLILLPLAILVASVMLVYSLVMAVKLRRLRCVMLVPRSYALMCSLRGLRLDIDEPGSKVFISVS